MVKRLQFPHAYYVRLSDEGKAKAEARAKTLGIKPAVALRKIIEKELKIKPKEG